MSYLISFLIEYNRVMPAVMLDARASIPQLKNQIGDVQKAYTDAQVALVTDNPDVIPYRIDTNDGNLAAYFTLLVNKTNNTASLYQFVLRPAFEQFVTDIQTEINNFISSGTFTNDYLPI